MIRRILFIIFCIFFGTTYIAFANTPNYSTAEVETVPFNPFLNNNSTQILDHKDVNLALGSLSFEETDLALPGKNGLNLEIKRAYSGSKYHNIQDHFHFQAGHGWSFNFAMRALYKLGVGWGNGKIAIESNSGIETFVPVSPTEFKPTRPGNFSKITIEEETNYINKITLFDTSGKKYIFSTKFLAYDPNYYKVRSMGGLHLTHIEDTYGNRITFEYETHARTINFYASYILLHQLGSEVVPPRYEHAHLRPNKIVDTFGREIHLNYEEPSSATTWANGRPVMLTSLTYTGTNGNLKTIQYHYNNNRRITQVDYDGIGSTYYTYEPYELRKDHYSTVQHINGIEDDNFWGQVLTSVTSPLGLKTTYEYAECFVGKDLYYTSADNVVHKPHPAQSFPVVSKKTIEESPGQSYSINYMYPTRSENPNLVQKVEYDPPGTSDSAFYFSEVTVDYPDGIQDETFRFDKGRMIEHEKGIIKTVTDWDYDNLRKNSVTKFRGGIQQTKTDHISYDTYNNPLEVHLYKGTTLYLIQEFVYNHDAQFLAQNLINLQKESSQIDPATQTRRSYSQTHTPQGKIASSLEGSLNTSAPSGSGQTFSVQPGATPITDYTYDATGRVFSQTNYGPNGPIVTQHSYTQGATYRIDTTINGKTSSTEHSPHTGQILKTTDTNGNFSTWTYDSHGRNTSITFPDGTQKTTAYPALNRQIQTYANRSIETIINRSGQVTEIIRPSGELSTKYTYAIGQRTEKYLGENQNYTLRKTYSYDHFRRPTSVTDIYFGTATTTYDDINNTITSTDPLGRQSIQTLNEFGQTIQEEYVPDGSIHTYTHTPFGDQKSMTDPNGITHSVNYDNYGRIISTVYPHINGTQTDFKSSNFYSSSGTLIQTTTRAKDGPIFRDTGFGYDSEGRPTQLSINGKTEESYTYDGSGPQETDTLVEVENDAAKLRTYYDKMGRLIKETTTVKSLNQQYDMRYTYAPNGQLASEILPDDSAINYSYTANQRLETITYQTQPIATLSYAANGTITQLTLGNGTTIDYTYEKEALVTDITVKSADETIIYQQQLTYDPLGKPTQSTQTNLFNPGQTLTRHYTYNQRDELSEVGLNATTPYYTYTTDKLGNRTQFTSAALPTSQLNITYDITQNQIQTLTTGIGKFQYTHDPAGNLTQKQLIHTDTQQQIAQFDYTYNYQDQLKQIHQNATPVATYAYAPNRQRILKTVHHPNAPDTTTLYHWNAAGQILAEATPEISIHTKYIYLGNEKIAMIKTQGNTENIYYFINNPQGTSAIIQDQSGTPIQKTQLDEFGNIEQSIGTLPNEVNFTGKKRDAESGLYYFNQRYYDSVTARFLTEDPDGEFFQFLVPVLIGAAVSACINIGLQLIATGSIDWGSVGKSAAFGGLSAGLSFGIGELGLKGLAKVAAHTVSGGIQSAVFGGNFFQGAGVGASVSAVTGGDPARGAVTGGFQRWFNHESHLVDTLKQPFDGINLEFADFSAGYLESSFGPIDFLLGVGGLIKGIKGVKGSHKIIRVPTSFSKKR